MDEHCAFAYQQEYGVPVTALGFFSGCGSGQNTTWWGGPQSVLINAALKDQPMEIHGDGQQTHSFTSISDHVDGILRTIFLPKAAGEIFNLASFTKSVFLISRCWSGAWPARESRR
jgi:UDP-glucose 4-epimerase